VDEQTESGHRIEVEEGEKKKGSQKGENGGACYQGPGGKNSSHGVLP